MINAQIVQLYEEEHLSPEEIAQVLSLEVESVKLALATGSKDFSKAAQKNNKLFSNSDMQQAITVMSGLMWSEIDGVRYRAAKFIINENAGRHDVSDLKGVVLNVNMINDQVAKAKAALATARNKVIDVPSEYKHLSE